MTNQTRNKRLEIRLTEKELLQIKENAQRHRTNVSEYIRWSILNRKVMQRVIVDDVSSARSRILYQLEMIGNNINQIAKLTNSGYVSSELFRIELRDMNAEIKNHIHDLKMIDREYNSQFKKAMAQGTKYVVINRTKGATENGDSQTSGKQEQSS